MWSHMSRAPHHSGSVVGVTSTDHKRLASGPHYTDPLLFSYIKALPKSYHQKVYRMKWRKAGINFMLWEKTLCEDGDEEEEEG